MIRTLLVTGAVAIPLAAHEADTVPDAATAPFDQRGIFVYTEHLQRDQAALTRSLTVPASTG